MTMNIVVALLVSIIVLLCTPLNRRTAVLRILGLCSTVLLVAYYLGPIVLRLVAYSYGWSLVNLGRVGTLSVVATLLGSISIVLLWRSDRRENQAIRAGSVIAFNRRVEALKSDPFNYDHEKAVEAATRIRDGK